jgi:hypothetical protein
MLKNKKNTKIQQHNIILREKIIPVLKTTILELESPTGPATYKMLLHSKAINITIPYIKLFVVICVFRENIGCLQHSLLLRVSRSNGLFYQGHELKIGPSYELRWRFLLYST